MAFFESGIHHFADGHIGYTELQKHILVPFCLRWFSKMLGDFVLRFLITWYIAEVNPVRIQTAR
jgi:hypothetical protein